MTDKIGLVSTAVSNLPGLEALCQSAQEKGLRISFSSLRTDALDRRYGFDTQKKRGENRHPGTGRRFRADATGHQQRHLRRRRPRGDRTPGFRRHTEHQTLLHGRPAHRGPGRMWPPSSWRCANRSNSGFWRQAEPANGIGRISVSLNAFVPKAFTPFQWTAMAPVKDLKEKFKMVPRRAQRGGQPDRENRPAPQ